MFRRQIHWQAIMSCMILMAILSVEPAVAQVPWPVEPTNADQPYGNVFGEFQQYGGNVYLHPGHDIRVDPAPKGPWVRSVREGLLRLYDNAGDPTNRYNGITIAASIGAAGTITARYWHLDHNSIQLSVRWAHALRRFNIRLRANVRMSQVVDWTSRLGNFHHLHYDVIEGGEFINPTTSELMGPDTDRTPPRVSEIQIWRNNSNTPIPRPATGPWTVSSDLDIIAEASDTNPPLPSIPWQGHIGIYRIEYSITELTGTGTHNVPTRRLYQFERFTTVGDGNAVARIIYKNVAPADSSSKYWTRNAERYYYIVTNVDNSGNLSEANGLWDTDGGNFPDGLYQIRVTAHDASGNHHSRNEVVFVKNNASSIPPPEVYIRDRAGDNGIIPSNPNREVFWASPDIRVDAPPYGVVNSTGRPFTQTSHENPKFGAVNRIWVRTHNLSPTASGPVRVRLYWADPAGGIPASEWQEIDAGTVKNIPSVPANGSATYSPAIEWTPPLGAIGHSCLLVRLESTQDPIVNDFDVPGENNIAQKNVSVLLDPLSGPSGFFVINPTEKFTEVKLIVDRSRFPKEGELIFEIPYTPRQLKLLRDVSDLQVEFKDEGQPLTLHLWGDRTRVPGFFLEAGQRLLVQLSTLLPPDRDKQANYVVNIAQEVDGTVTGGLTFDIPGAVADQPAQLAYRLDLAKGVNLIDVPLDPEKPWHLSDLASFIGPELVFIVWYNPAEAKFISYFADFPDTSPANALVTGGEGYFVVMSQPKIVTFVGKGWSNTAVPLAAPTLSQGSVMALDGLMLDGLSGKRLNEIHITVKNRRTGEIVTGTTGEYGIEGRYTLTMASRSGPSVALSGDELQISVFDLYGQPLMQMRHQVTLQELENSLLSLPGLQVSLTPEYTELLANYPNPFNPETWIPFKLATSGEVSFEIYNALGQRVRALSLGHLEAGNYMTPSRSLYWDGRNGRGERVASGTYFYTMRAGEFQATRRMIIVK